MKEDMQPHAKCTDPVATIWNYMDMFRDAAMEERARTASGCFIKNLVAHPRDSERLGDVLFRGRDDGIALHFGWGAHIDENLVYRAFFPVTWSNEYMDRIECWYRIK